MCSVDYQEREARILQAKDPFDLREGCSTFAAAGDPFPGRGLFKLGPSGCRANRAPEQTLPLVSREFGMEE